MNFLGEIAMPVKRWWRLLHETAKMRRSHCSFRHRQRVSHRRSLRRKIVSAVYSPFC